MSMTDPAALIERLVAEVYNRGHLAPIEQLFAPTVLVDGQAATVWDVSEGISCFKQLFPGRQCTLDVISTAGDLVAVHWTIHYPAASCHDTGQRSPDVARTGVRLFRIADGRIAEVWFNCRALEQLQAHPALRLPDLPAGLSTEA